MKVSLNVRGIDHRGEFSIQTRVDAPDLMKALDNVIEVWALDRRMLTKIHVQPELDVAR